ncbi:hypothetical protein D3C81_1136090 [compost metagenome]
MTTQAVGEQGTPGVVVHFTGVCVARFPETAALVALGPSGRVAVLAIGAAVEIAQVSLQRAGADGHCVDQAEEVLLVEIFEAAVVVLGGQVLGDLVVAAGEDEAVRIGQRGAGRGTGGTCRAADAQIDIVGGTAGLGALQLAGGECQAVDFA